MNMDTDDRHDRVGSRDVEAAELFAAARAFRPSARARRRTMRALGLPVGLSLVGSSLAHAAHLLTASLKGWGIVAGVVGAVGAAGSVAYVARTPSPSRSLSSADRGGDRHGPSKPAAARTVAGAPIPLSAAVEAPAVGAGTAEAAPLIAVGGSPLPSLDDVPSFPKPARRAPVRPRSRALPSDSPSTDGSPPSPVSSVDWPAERPIAVVAPTEPPRLVPEISAHASGGLAFRPPAPIPAASPRSSPPSSPASSQSSSQSSPLRGELAIVAEAQSLLRAGDGPATRAVLDRHARVYPGGVLAEEVEVLRLRAFLADGDARGARQTGETFLRSHPASPLAARVRSLISGLGSSRRDAPSPSMSPQTNGESP